MLYQYCVACQRRRHRGRLLCVWRNHEWLPASGEVVLTSMLKTGCRGLVMCLRERWAEVEG
jgi:hypothetical protein